MKLNLKSLKSLGKLGLNIAKKHSPELLVGLGIAGMATGTVLAVKATPKAVTKIDDEIEQQNDELREIALDAHKDVYSPIDRLPVKDVIKLTWKDYMPAAITTAAGVICIVGGTHVSLRRNAALVTAVKLSEVAINDLQEYKNKASELIGADKVREIEDAIDSEYIENKVKDGYEISGSGDILYFDKLGGQIFKADKEQLRAAINRLNQQLNNDVYVSLNDLYSEIGLEPSTAGEKVGWNRDDGLIEIRDTSSKLLQNGVPARVFDTRPEPKIKFDTFR